MNDPDLVYASLIERLDAFYEKSQTTLFTSHEMPGGM